VLVDDILERNRQFVSRRQPQDLPPAEAKTLVVVACYDPRLDDMLLPALGLASGETFLLRTAGALVQPGGGVMRSLTMAVFMFGAKEILVLGHSSCRMASFTTSAFIDMFRARGVRRDSFGPTDLREWAGAIASPGSGVRRSVETITGATFLPRDLSVSGAVLDDRTGAIELVVRDGRPIGSASPSSDESDAEEEPEREPRAAAEPESSPERGATAADELGPFVGAIADVVQKLEHQSKWRYELKSLREQLSGTSSPLARFRALETFLRHAAGDSREVAQSLARLRHELHASGGALPETLTQLLHRLARGRP